MSDQTDQSPYPNPIRRSVKLSDGRTLAYNIFYNDNDEENKDRHPVLYFHGFPSSGLEGSFCAAQVFQAGGQMYAVDRPGFGYSDPFPKEVDNDPYARLESFCQSVWELIEHLQWKRFSIIGLSGGGLFTVAMLESYLRRKSEDTTSTTMGKLEAISIVAGIYAPAGMEGMMSSNQTLARAVDANRTWMLWTNFLLFSVVKALPEALILKMLPISQLPEVDQDFMANPVVARQAYRVVVDAMRQAPSWAATLEALLCFKSSPNQRMEESLKRFFSTADESCLPRVSLFHGSQDVNVPASHSIYVHEQLLQKRSKLHLYEDHGHASIAFTNLRETFARAVMP